MSLTVDESEWPLVVCRYSGAPTADELATFLDRIEAILARRQKHALLLVADRSASASVARRREMTSWMRKHAEDLKAYRVGVAYVVPTPVVRGLLFALFTVTAQSHPYAIVATEDEARTWLKDRLKDAL